MASTETKAGTASPARLTPEAELLLASAGGPTLDGRIGELVARPLDWSLFLQLVAQERAEGPVARRLAHFAATIPAQPLKELRTMALRADLRMGTVDRRLQQTLGAFQQAGIPVLLLKGAALAQAVYRSFPDRPMLDIDLLVAPDQIARAHDVALGCGWAHFADEGIDHSYEGHFHLPPLMDARHGHFNLELHAALFIEGHPFHWPLDGIWARSAALPDSTARLPSREDLLLHVALHYAWSHLAQAGAWRSFRDVNVLCDEGRLDWDRFLALARKSRGGSAVYWTLRLARRFSAAAVPARVEAALRPPGAAWLQNALERHLANQCFRQMAACPSVRLERRMWRAAVRPGHYGHGDAVPWAGNAHFEELEPVETESLLQKVVRHTVSGGQYLRYLHRVTRPE